MFNLKLPLDCMSGLENNTRRLLPQHIAPNHWRRPVGDRFQTEGGIGLAVPELRDGEALQLGRRGKTLHMRRRVPEKRRLVEAVRRVYRPEQL